MNHGFTSRTAAPSLNSLTYFRIRSDSWQQTGSLLTFITVTHEF